MRWERRRRSQNVEDRRGARVPGKVKAGIGGIGAIVVALIAVWLGKDPSQFLGQLGGGAPGGNAGGGEVAFEASPEEERLVEFVKVVLADTEDVWNRLLPSIGQPYREPTLVLFRDAVQSACGFAEAAMGPFYCGADSKVYIDLGFYNDLKKRHGAPGDFAQAYVIAHEVGHHIQNLLGKSTEVHRAKGRISEAEYNQLSVRLELQADFYAGVWAHHAQRTKNILEPGDLEEALRAASAIGDDRLQKQARGYVTPETFTHGTSEQRVRWFRRGFESGDLSLGDTFSARRL